MATLLAFVLAAATVQAPAAAEPARGPRITAIGHAVAVILPAATNETDERAGTLHRRPVQGPGGPSILFE